MSTLAIVLQLVIALGIINVWVLRPGKATPWRPEGARSLAEEFRRYGLPDWMRHLVGTAKLSLAVLLIVGIWYPSVALAAAIGIAILMAGAVGAHLKIGDPLRKALPSFTLLVLSVFVAYAHSA